MDSTTKNMIITSFNCKSIKRSVQCVRHLTAISDLIALQETWLLPHDLNFVHEINKDFSCVAKSSVDTSVGMLRGRPYGGLAIMWNKNKFPNVYPVDCANKRINAIRVTITSGSFLLINVYMPVDVHDNLPEFTDCLAEINAIIEESDVQIAYIVGDFNAHPNANFGKELLQFCKDTLWECADINILGINSDTYTFQSESHGSRRWLDHCLTTQAAWQTVTGVNILHDVLWSDHYPVCILCKLSDETTAPTICDGGDSLKYVKWGTKNTEQINKYGEYCFNNLDKFIDTCVCDCVDIPIHGCLHKRYFIDKYYNHIVSVLQHAAIVSSRSGENKRHKKVVGWNYHVRDSHEAARMYFRSWVVAGRPSEGTIYKNMRDSRAAFKNKIRWCQKNEENIKCNILALHRKHKNFIKFWNATKKFNYKQTLPISVEGLQEPAAIAELFAKRFQADPLPTECVLDADNFDLTETDMETIMFTQKEITKVVNSMKRGKSPGHDGLSIEHILWGSDRVNYHLCALFNLIMQNSYLPRELMRTTVIPVAKNKTGNLSCSSNYRPISLGTIVGKILERLIHPKLKENLKIDDAQFGFRAGLSTDAAIMSLKSAVHYYTSRGTSVYGCFLDLSRAFDLVNYKILWAKLRASGVPVQLVNLLKFWYGGQTNNVRWGDSTSSSYSLECGVRQGGLTSPDLFNCYVNDLIEELRSTKVGCHLGNVCVNNLSYADDMVLLSPSIKGLRKLLSVCEHYANAHGLKYNVLKTEVMVFKSGRGPERVPEVYLNGTTVKRVQQFKYLGHMLTERLQDDCDIERERRALAIRSNMIARRFSKCSKDVKVTLFKAYCLCLYTCQLWTSFTRKAINTIRVQYNDAYRILMKLPRYCSASSMFAEARVPDFFAILRMRVASFWGRLSRSPNMILKAVADNLGSQIFKYWISVHLNENKK